MFLLLPGFLPAAQVPSDDAVAALLARSEAPPGVVFELVEGDAAAWEWAGPKVSDYARRLRARFPGLQVAVVSHGSEMFSLQSAMKSKNIDAHAGVAQLSQREDVPVHVCGTFAEMRGLAPEAFPGFVDVAPSGPAQIRGYQELGYILVRLRR